MKIEIVFPYATPSGWEFKGGPKHNRFQGQQVLMGWNRKFDTALKGFAFEKKWNAKEKRTVTVIRYETKRKWLRDKKNLINGCTPLFDALVRAKLLVDDSMKWLDDIYKQEEGNPSTKVIIEWEEESNVKQIKSRVSTRHKRNSTT